jgi:hypothetical protein
MSEESSVEVSESVEVESQEAEVSEVADLGAEEASESEETTEEVEAAEEEIAEEPLHEIIVDGEKIRLTMSEMTELAQKGKSSAQKFKEAAKLRKEAAIEKSAIQAALQGSPEALFDLKIKSGTMSPEQLKQWIIQEAIKIAEEPELTPEQIKMQAMEAQLEQYEKEQARIQKESEDTKFQEEVERYKEEYSGKLSAAIKAGGLENDPTAVRRVAMALQDSIDETGSPMMEIEDAIQYVKSEERGSYKEFLSGLDLDQLEQILGQEKMASLRKKDLSKLANPESAGTVPQKPTPRVKPAAREGSLKDFLESL